MSISVVYWLVYLTTNQEPSGSMPDISNLEIFILFIFQTGLEMSNYFVRSDRFDLSIISTDDWR